MDSRVAEAREMIQSPWFIFIMINHGLFFLKVEWESYTEFPLPTS
jgi:hypothetical protein